MRKPRLITMIFMACAAWLLSAAPAAAAPTAFGIRGGFTDDPSAVFLGGHVSIAPRSARNLLIQPSMELGLDDDSDFFFLRANLHFMYMIPISRDAAFYPLFGPSLFHLDPDGGDAYNNVGLDLGMGFEFSAIAFELNFGLMDDLPDLTFTIAYTFW